MGTNRIDAMQLATTCVSVAIAIGLKRLPIAGVGFECVHEISKSLQEQTGDVHSEQEVRSLISNVKNSTWRDALSNRLVMLADILPGDQINQLRERLENMPENLRDRAEVAVVNAELALTSVELSFLKEVRELVQLHLDNQRFPEAYHLLCKLSQTPWFSIDDAQCKDKLRLHLERTAYRPALSKNNFSTFFLDSWDGIATALVGFALLFAAFTSYLAGTPMLLTGVLSLFGGIAVAIASLNILMGLACCWGENDNEYNRVYTEHFNSTN